MVIKLKVLKKINALYARGLFCVYDLFSFYIYHRPSILFHKLVAFHLPLDDHGH